MEWNFWVDQNTTRKMMIGKVNPIVKAKLQKKKKA